ncbi:MAG: AraC family ligand binding domain-containing protein [Eubacterium sp.]|nr:AraC family ligand binding domain-containing protein [Eubacterium sp.]
MALSPYTIKISQQGKELVSHGTPAFPAACYLDDLNLEPSPWHWHEELEAGVVSEGTVLISAGGNTVSLTAGAGFFINSGTLHMIAPASAGPCHVHSIVFHPRIIGGTPETVFWQKYLHPLIHHMTEFVYFMNPDTGLHDALLNQSGGSRNGSGCCSKAASPAGTAYPGTDQSFISTVCEEIEYC